MGIASVHESALIKANSRKNNPHSIRRHPRESGDLAALPGGTASRYWQPGLDSRVRGNDG